MRGLRWLSVGALGLALLAGFGYRAVRRNLPQVLTQVASELPVAGQPEPTEAELAARFLREHPGEQPLNHAIGQAALRLHQERPMGTFVLSVTPGAWGNDCSDFVAAAVDDGLGVKARFRRGSRDHLLGERWQLFDFLQGAPDSPVQPGDIISVRHSPWYDPSPTACWHVGVMGSDGRVYDFTKLRSWRTPRYGRHTYAEFVHHSHGPGELVIQRLRPEYRYRVWALPEVGPGA